MRFCGIWRTAVWFIGREMGAIRSRTEENGRGSIIKGKGEGGPDDLMMRVFLVGNGFYCDGSTANEQNTKYTLINIYLCIQIEIPSSDESSPCTYGRLSAWEPGWLDVRTLSRHAPSRTWFSDAFQPRKTSQHNILLILHVPVPS